MDWTIGPLDYWTIFGLFFYTTFGPFFRFFFLTILGPFLDHFIGREEEKNNLYAQIICMIRLQLH